MIREPERRSNRLARRLAELARSRSLGEEPSFATEELVGSDVAPAGPMAAVGTAPYMITRVPVGIEELLAGGVLEDERGKVFLHERLRSSIERFDPAWGRLRSRRRAARRHSRTGVPGPEWLWQDAEEEAWRPTWETEASSGVDSGDGEALDDAVDEVHRELAALSRLDLTRVLFLDLETGGLGGACVFLAGVMRWNGGDFVVRQYFARDYGEEAALLARVVQEMADAAAVVTFNGKSFDVPMLRDRTVRHRLPAPPVSLHVDLLRHARAAWSGRVPDCRLTTLEAYVCHRRRIGDVPGDRVPGLYHDFVRRGGAERLLPVFHHNLLDVLTMEELLRRLYGS